ncbi:MAG: hypothetical protein K0Q90_3980 [Paenibacillaceae bacterium]|nr:hypothetical protein [Paenibacillaceae bacterium]
MLKKWFSQVAAAGMVIALAVALAACGGKDAAEAPVGVQPTLAGAATTVPSSSSPATGYVTAAAETNAPPEKTAANNYVQQAGNEAKPTAAATTKPKKTYDPYTVEKPLLMGVAIGDSQDSVLKLHGSPKSNYLMDDAEDPITVYEYDGFHIGLNPLKQVEFIEVASSEEDPGLNGLRLDQTTADAAKALGKPDSSTDYVMTYKTKTTVLKLDIDTKSKTIQSIKLFGRSE